MVSVASTEVWYYISFVKGSAFHTSPFKFLPNSFSFDPRKLYHLMEEETGEAPNTAVFHPS